MQRLWACRSLRPQHTSTAVLVKRFLALSSVQGPLDPPLATQTLPDYFATEILDKHSTRPALVCRDESRRAHGGPPSRNLGVTSHLAWDFDEFDRHIRALSNGLLNMGVKKNDRVGVVMGNNRYVELSWRVRDADVYMTYSAYAMLQWACARIGAVLVTINPAYRLNELVSVLQGIYPELNPNLCVG